MCLHYTPDYIVAMSTHMLHEQNQNDYNRERIIYLDGKYMT